MTGCYGSGERWRYGNDVELNCDDGDGSYGSMVDLVALVYTVVVLVFGMGFTLLP